MSLRWRENGDLLCAAKHDAEDGDTYIDDRLHYQLSIVQHAIISHPDEEKNGIWYWNNLYSVLEIIKDLESA